MTFLTKLKTSRPRRAAFLCCLGGLSGVVKVCTFRTTAYEAIGGLRVEALSGSLSSRRRSSRGKIGQLAEGNLWEADFKPKGVQTKTTSLDQH